MNIESFFGPTGHINGAQECARAAIILAYGLVLVRVAGRRVFAQWTALDIIVAIVTGSTLSRALTGNADLFGTLAATTLLMVLHRALSRASSRWPAISRWLEGRPVRLAENGRVDSDTLQQHAVSMAALDEAVRRAGLQGVHAADLIVLEPSGNITVMKAPAHWPRADESRPRS